MLGEEMGMFEAVSRERIGLEVDFLEKLTRLGIYLERIGSER